jgi:LicD family
MDELKVETWIAHGALLGWYWNQALLPWDTDLDVQISAESMAFLAKSHNMTKYQYRMPDEETPRIYLLDINPHYSILSSQDVANKIDGRWIDTTDGKFINITAVHYEEAKSSTLFCKDGHQYEVSLPSCEQSPQMSINLEPGRRHISTTAIVSCRHQG